MLLHLPVMQRAAIGIVLVALLALANLIGNASSYIYLLVLIAAWPVLLFNPAARAAMNRWESYGYQAAFVALAIAFAATPGGRENFENLGNFLPFLLFIPAIALFRNAGSPNNAVIVAVLALIGSLLAIASAYTDVEIMERRRAVGLFNITNHFATASVMLGFLALMGVWAVRNWRRYLFLAGPAAGTGAAILAGTRSAVLLALVLGLVFLTFVALRLDARKRLVLLAAVVGAMGIVAGAVLWLGDDVRAFSAFETLAMALGGRGAIDGSTAIRMELYSGGIGAFLDAPIFGHGWDAHLDAANVYMDPDIVHGNASRWGHLHNDYINFAAFAGIFGLFAYALYMLIPVVGTLRSVRDGQYFTRVYAGIVMALCYAIYGLFGSSFQAELLLCFGPVMMAVLLGFCRDGAAAR